MSGADCIQFVRLCAARLAGPEREEFLMGLADLLNTEEASQDGTLELTHRPNGNGNGLRNNNQGATDRSRSGNRTGRDRKPGAMDSAIRGMNTANFLKRFPMADVSFSGTGR
jgi:hypothetical protein